MPESEVTDPETGPKRKFTPVPRDTPEVTKPDPKENDSESVSAHDLTPDESVPETETQIEETRSSETTLNRGRTCRCLYSISPSGYTCRCLYNILSLMIFCLSVIVYCILRDITDRSTD